MFIKILLKYILGYVRITVEGYYIERFINICTTSKILIWNLKREKGVRLYLNIGIKDFFEAVKIAKKLKCKVKIIQKRGIPFFSASVTDRLLPRANSPITSKNSSYFFKASI